jgi:hypothetical protein
VENVDGDAPMETILNQIHRSSLELLASVGIRFHCPEIIDREMIRMVTRSIQAPSYTDDDFALGVIRETGPGGQYLTKKHTLAHCRSVPFFTKLCPPPFARALQREIGIAIFSWGTLMDFAYSITVHRDYYGHV